MWQGQVRNVVDSKMRPLWSDIDTGLDSKANLEYSSITQQWGETLLYIYGGFTTVSYCIL